MAEGPTIQELMSGFFIEICISLILYGITVAQTYIYYLNYGHEDTRFLRGVVACVMVLETAHTVFTIHMTYFYLITDFGQVGAIGHIIWSAGACVTSGMVIVAFAQGFYVMRIYMLSKRNIALTVLIGFMLLLRISFGLATSALTYRLGTWSVFRAKVGPLFTLSTGLGLSAAVDLLIALTLMYYLRRGRSGFKETDHLIHSLIAYAVNTGAITMLVSITIVLTFVFLKESLLFAGLVQLSSKLYANSFLGTLNARQILRKKINTLNSTELSDRRHIEIFQETSKVVDHDDSMHDISNKSHQIDTPAEEHDVEDGLSGKYPPL
ncbi:hypothetical protein QCA50_002734 [Cerrena zonata]|uniref:DUF6534 domain-containing protein n=1 Tax=Cerrena zonata TaxID=2478898 RepID=A0AAW0GSK4_9APHY